MANPDPSPETRFQPGNRAGCGRRTPITSRLRKLIRDQKLGDTLALAWLGAAMGDENLLQGRKPNYAFFSMLLDRIEGKLEAGDASPGEVVADLVAEAERRAEARREERGRGPHE